MTPEQFRAHGHRLIDWIADYRARVADRPVMARTEPGEVRGRLPPSPPEHAEDFVDAEEDATRWNLSVALAGAWGS